MGLLTNIKRKLIERKFASKNLNIIQNVDDECVGKIMNTLKIEGWETDNFQGHFNPDMKKWTDTFRKGQSSLCFTWDSKELGSIVGPARIVSGIAKDYSLSAYDRPQGKMTNKP